MMYPQAHITVHHSFGLMKDTLSPTNSVSEPLTQLLLWQTLQKTTSMHVTYTDKGKFVLNICRHDHIDFDRFVNCIFLLFQRIRGEHFTSTKATCIFHSSLIQQFRNICSFGYCSFDFVSAFPSVCQKVLKSKPLFPDAMPIVFIRNHRECSMKTQSPDLHSDFTKQHFYRGMEEGVAFLDLQN